MFQYSVILFSQQNIRNSRLHTLVNTVAKFDKLPCELLICDHFHHKLLPEES
jgi:hypothetical protein